MAVRRPTASIRIGARVMSPPAAAVARVRVLLGRGHAHDAAWLDVGPASPLQDAAPGSACELALGYDGQTTPVLTGTLVAVGRRPWGAQLHVLAKPHALCAARIGQAYVRQSVADIVRDLLARAGVRAGVVDAATSVSVYHVDERRSVWSHIGKLARLAGCQVTTGADGALSFRPFRTGPTADHVLRAGAELLDWCAGVQEVATDDVAVVPHGAASELGADRWNVLLREPDGGAPEQPTVVSAALRERGAANALEQAIASASGRRAYRGEVVVMGDADLRSGDLVELSGVPGAGTLLRSTEVDHVLDAPTGFHTVLRLEAAA